MSRISILKFDLCLPLTDGYHAMCIAQFPEGQLIYTTKDSQTIIKGVKNATYTEGFVSVKCTSKDALDIIQMAFKASLESVLKKYEDIEILKLDGKNVFIIRHEKEVPAKDICLKVQDLVCTQLNQYPSIKEIEKKNMLFSSEIKKFAEEKTCFQENIIRELDSILKYQKNNSNEQN